MEAFDVYHLLQETGALLSGHFLLSSGLHSPQYVQCARLLQFPTIAGQVGAALAERFGRLGATPEVVVAPALGGIIIAHEVARALGVRCLFAEREQGVMTLRRGFELADGENAVVVEDVVTTGGSTRETMAVVVRAGARVSAVGAIIDRSGGRADFGVPFAALMALTIPTYHPNDCPLCQGDVPLVKPGSRALKSSEAPS
ncbi:MAG: orotate phosphoribosyltransferase [Chloracidobacterium sp.]|nr:orotate phosphoribosyltransferase [Chloracidobacterium sp.]MDW8216705.1 orotate phosphoribosyltransferase [Acidobacteriota bacterium]